MPSSTSPPTASKTPSTNNKPSSEGSKKLPLDKGGRGDSLGTRQNYLAQIHIARSWAFKNIAGFSDENYREMIYPLMDSQGVPDEIYPTAAALDDEHLAKLLASFKKLGWIGHWKKPQKTVKYVVPQAEGMITQKQADYIHSLQRQLKWDDAHLQNFISRQAKKKTTTTISMLTKTEAGKVIFGLQQTLEPKEE
jgi:Protein of unknown function (DUF1018)